MRVDRFHFITRDVPDKSHEEMAEIACAAGARWVQLRIKGESFTEWLRIARQVREICDRHGAQLIINDNVVVAKESGAEGVHLGRMDMDPQRARHILGEGAIIGGTANTEEDVERLLAARVDYIGLGPFRTTTTKKDLAPVLGAEGVRRVIEQVNSLRPGVPVVAIGGITHADIPVLLQAGVHGVAVSSAVVLAADREQAVRAFMQMLYGEELRGGEGSEHE